MTAVLFKEESADYSTVLGDDYDLVYYPVLSFISNEAAISRMQLLLESQDFVALVVTSPRAAAILAQATLPIDPLTAYCVGKRTAECLDHRFIAKGTEAGYANALIDIVVEDCRSQKGRVKILFVSGTSRLDTIPAGLNEAGIEFEEVAVYTTVPSQSISLPNFDGPKRLFFVMFSPSGVSCIDSVPNNCSFVAIGNTTADAIKLKFNGSDLAIAPQPTPVGVKYALDSLNL